MSMQGKIWTENSWNFANLNAVITHGDSQWTGAETAMYMYKQENRGEKEKMDKKSQVHRVLLPHTKSHTWSMKAIGKKTILKQANRILCEKCECGITHKLK